jgi:UDP-3-O-[3-hydroxymyristoyl] N-acetylglucosamine deacetylase
MKTGRQTTLKDQTVLSGIGVHTGLPVTLTMHPADAGSGIRFIRTGLGGREREIRADIHSVTATEFATVLGDASGPLVSTAEHVLAALRGLGVDNAVIEIDGPEVPIMDGSAAAFVAAIDQVGIETQAAPRRFIRVLKPVKVTSGSAYGELRPYHGRGLHIETEISFDHPLIGRQTLAFDCTPELFRRDIARARTFGFMRDVAKLWSAGYALGASLENTIVVTDNRVLNPEGTRYADEFVRHKALDAIGDLALAGAPLIGAYRSVRGGHKLNYAVLTALMADTSAWTMVEDTARPVRGHADLATATAAFAPDVS